MAATIITRRRLFPSFRTSQVWSDDTETSRSVAETWSSDADNTEPFQRRSGRRANR
jgi:hypothetical protein